MIVFCSRDQSTCLGFLVRGVATSGQKMPTVCDGGCALARYSRLSDTVSCSDFCLRRGAEGISSSASTVTRAPPDGRDAEGEFGACQASTRTCQASNVRAGVKNEWTQRFSIRQESNGTREKTSRPDLPGWDPSCSSVRYWRFDVHPSLKPQLSAYHRLHQSIKPADAAVVEEEG